MREIQAGERADGPSGRLPGKKGAQSFSLQATWYFIGRAAADFITLAVPVIYVRIFSKNDYGSYAQFLLIHGFFFRILQFGFLQSLYYFLPKYERQKKYYVTNTCLFFLAAGFAIQVVLLIFKGDIAIFFNAPELASLLPLCGLHTLFMLVASPFEIMLIVESKAEAAAWVSFFSEILRGICVISFVLFYKTVMSAIVGLVCFSAVRFLLYSAFVLKHYGLRVDADSSNYLKDQLRYAAPVGFSGILGTVGKRIDRFILAAFFTPEVFAVYSIGSFKLSILDIFFSSIVDVTIPRTVRLLKDNKVGEFLLFWNRLIVRLAFVGLGAFFLLQTVAGDLITLVFTTKYESSVIVYRIVLLILLAQMLSYGVILRSLGYTKDIFNSNLLAFISAIPLTYFLVKNFGLTGAAVSAVTVYFVNAISQLFLSVKRLDKRLSEVLPVGELLKLAAIGAVLFLGLFRVQDVVPSRIMRIIFSTGVFSLAYVYACYKFRVFNVFQEEFVRKVWHRLKLIGKSNDRPNAGG